MSAEQQYDDTDGEIMLAEPRGEDFGSRMASAQQLVVPQNQQQLSARQVGDLFGTLTTAQPVIKERNIPALMQTLKVLAETFGEDYIYSWDVNDKNSKRADKKTTIEGPTINLTNDLAREFGNCSVEPREIEMPNHWIFYGRFTDLQTGYTLTRAFRQRKNALAGNYENDRKLDMAYQMGQSKCLRNVVVNALRNYADYMVRVAKGALVKKITADPEFYIGKIDAGLAKFGISLHAAEAMVGMVKAQWTARDIAKVFSALKGVAEGLVDAKEAFPQDGPQVPDHDQDGVVKDDKTSAGDGADAGEQTASAKGSPAAKAVDESELEAPAASTAKAKDKAKKADAPPAEKKAEPAAKKAAPKPAALFDQ